MQYIEFLRRLSMIHAAWVIFKFFTIILRSYSLVFQWREANDWQLEIYFSEEENIFTGNRFVYEISVIRELCQLVKFW